MMGQKKAKVLESSGLFHQFGLSREVLSGLLEEPPNFILYSSRMYPDIKNVSRHIDEAATTNFAEYQT